MLKNGEHDATRAVAVKLLLGEWETKASVWVGVYFVTVVGQGKDRLESYTW